MSHSLSTKPEGYEEFFKDLKQRVQRARVSASLSVNKELVGLYGALGKDILDRQEKAGWGGKVLT